MDWVKAFFDCSIEHAWIVLRERLKSDYERWLQLSKANDGPVRILNLSEDTDRLMISKKLQQHNKREAWVTVEKKDHEILSTTQFNGSSHPVMRFIPTLNEKAECRLLLDGNELEFWQVSRRI